MLVVLLRKLLDDLAPKVPDALLSAVATYLDLLTDLLLRGARPGDEKRLVRELRDPASRVCFEKNVVHWEFGRILGTVVHFGPREIPDEGLAVLWPPMTSADQPKVRKVVSEIQQVIAETADLDGGELLLPAAASAGFRMQPDALESQAKQALAKTSAKRGAPRKPISKSVVAMGAREKIFEGTNQPWTAIAAAIAEASGGTMNQESAYRKMKEARARAPVPKGWSSTLLAKRIEPLHVDKFGPEFLERWQQGIGPFSPRRP